MRKTFLLFLLSFLALTASAQFDDVSETPAQKYRVATGSFWSNWFVQADFALSSFYGDRANAPASLPSGLFENFRTNAGLSLAIGKWFTPGLGLRTELDGFWGRSVIGQDKKANASKFWMLSEQTLFNFSNMFAGYSDTRRWNLIPYLGIDLGRSMTRNTYALGFAAGLLNQWRLTPKLAVNLDLSWDILEPDFDGAGGNLAGHGLRTKDQRMALSVGLTYHLGNPSFSPIPDTETLNVLTQSQIEALNAQLADEQAENARLRAIITSTAKETQE
ncbi:MAG: OmpA family protein [Prevotella sp.]|nr:OmpA family protein [Prevotella sp.]